MARPKGPGKPLEPGGGRSPGPPEQFGHRPARDALARGEPLRGLAEKAQQAALERYELSGVYELALDNASRIQAVADCHWHAYLAAEMAENRNPKTIMDLGNRVVNYLRRATEAWVNAEEMRQARDAKVVDYEQILRENESNVSVVKAGRPGVQTSQRGGPNGRDDGVE